MLVPRTVPSAAGKVQVGSLKLLAPAPRLSSPLWRRSLLQSDPGFPAALQPASARSREGGRSPSQRAGDNVLCLLCRELQQAPGTRRLEDEWFD